MSRRAFTLIEMLVTIGIIAIVIALLFPLITSARRGAQTINCTSNLRQIGIAIHSHASERGGYAPLGGMIIVPSSFVGATSISAALEDGARNRYDYIKSGSPLVREVIMPLHGALAAQLGMKYTRFDSFDSFEVEKHSTLADWSTFTCPSARPRAPSATTFVIQFEGQTMLNVLNGLPFDFALNDAVFGFDCKPSRRLAGKLSKVHNPSKTFLLADAAPPFASMAFRDGAPLFWSPEAPPGSPLTLADAFVENGRVTSQVKLFDLQRHRGRINVLYADGHVGEELLTAQGLSGTIVANW